MIKNSKAKWETFFNIAFHYCSIFYCTDSNANVNINIPPKAKSYYQTLMFSVGHGIMIWLWTYYSSMNELENLLWWNNEK